MIGIVPDKDRITPPCEREEEEELIGCSCKDCKGKIGFPRNEMTSETFEVMYSEQISWLKNTHMKTIDKKQVSNIKFGGIDHGDHPDYCDAFIESADHEGREMTDEEIELLNEDRDFVLERLYDQLY
jgi:hypothetical protein